MNIIIVATKNFPFLAKKFTPYLFWVDTFSNKNIGLTTEQNFFSSHHLTFGKDYLFK